MIKVLVTEDSSVIRSYLEQVLNNDPELTVVGTACNGLEAVEKAAELKPDVITMDIHMPGMDGFEATRKIMETNPVPIVICSASWDPTEVSKTFRSMEAGAVAALEKPRGFSHTDSDDSLRQLIDTVKAMSSVKVVRRWARLRKKETVITSHHVHTGHKKRSGRKTYKIVAVGSSTGGPLALQSLLSNIDRDFPVPIVIVQHIAPGFLTGLADWLGKTTKYDVKIAENNENILPRKAYLAPDRFHMLITKDFKVKLISGESRDRLCPSVAHLFKSIGDEFGMSGVGVLLTGMGRDGAAELKEMHDKGALTFAQDEDSCIVFGMPGEAVALGAADKVLPCPDIAEELNKMLIDNDAEFRDKEKKRVITHTNQ